jgi:hypothetical protein
MSLQGYFILAIVVIGLGMAMIMVMRNNGVRIGGRFIRAIWAWRINHNKYFIAGVQRGLQDYRQGKMRPWADVKKELDL